MKLENKVAVFALISLVASLVVYKFGSASALYPNILDYINHAPNELVIAFYGSLASTAIVWWVIGFLRRKWHS